MILDMSVSLASSATSLKRAEADTVDGEMAGIQAKIDSAGNSQPSEAKQVAGSKGRPEVIKSDTDGGERAKLEEQLASLRTRSEGLRAEIKADETKPDENKDKVAGRAQSPQGQAVASNDKPQEVKSDSSVARSDNTATAQPAKKLEEAK